MNVDLKAGIVRVIGPDGETAGTGFVVTDDGLIATCAHVAQGAGARPSDTVRVAFHATGEEREAQVEPEWWRALDAEDVAILRLDGPVPEGVMPLPLGSSAGVEGHTLSTFGFPDPKPVEGMAGKCEVVGRTTERGFPVLQLRSSEVTPGFSGAPVFDIVTRRVVGMVTAITVPDQYGRLPETAFITPTETLRAVCPVLQLSDLCPYQGLAAFTENHAEFFFGRDKLVADLVAHLRGNPRFLAVVGPSGSGKSSVVRAGLFPTLRQGEVPGSEKWHLLTFRPGADPFAALTTAGLDVPQKSDLPAAIRAFLEIHPQVKRLVLFADQFEELFTLCPQPVQERFLRQLAALLEGNLAVTVVLTLRADFYGHLLRHRPLVDWLKVGQVNVPSMGPEELRAAVEEPALRLGLRFEPGLVETIVEEAGTADHPLPLLESALTQLWEKREDGLLTHAAYQAVGQVAGAIGQWAEDTYTALVPEEQSLAQRIFARLVRYGEGEVADTRQQQSLSELVTRPEEQEPLHQLVQRLANARLLVTGGDPGTETVEIIHDALLQQWGRLKHWTAEQREFYLWRQRLDERLQEWEEKGQDEGALLRGALLAEAGRWLEERSDNLNLDEQAYIRESIAQREREQMARERLRQRITLAAVGAAVVFLALALLAWGQRKTAVDEAHTRATAQAEAVHAQATAIAEAEAHATAQVVAEEQRQVAVARQLASQAELERSLPYGSWTLASLLANESLHRFPTVEASVTLYRLLALLARPVTCMEHEGKVAALAVSPDGRWIASGGWDGTARVWEAATGREVARMECEGWVKAVAFSPDGQWVASGYGIPHGKTGGVVVWEAATGQEVARMEHEGLVEDVAFSPNGNRLVTGSMDGTGRVWETSNEQELVRVQYEGVVRTVAFSPDGQWVALGYGIWSEALNESDISMGGAVVLEIATGREVARVEHTNWVESVAISPDGRWVVSAAPGDFEARVWEATTGREVARLEGYPNRVAFSSDGHRIVSGDGNGIVQVWEAETGLQVAHIECRYGVSAVAFSPDGKWVMSGGYDHTARVWEVSTGREVARMTHEEWVTAMAFSPDGQWAVSGSYDGAIHVWRVASLEHEGWVEAVAFSSDGQWLVSGSTSAAVVWEVSTGLEVARMKQEEWVTAVAFSPDGRWVASGSADGTARVWEAATGEEVARMEQEEWVNAVAFNPDGRWVALGSRDNTAKVFEAATGREVARMTHQDWVEAVAFSPDGKWVVSGSRDGMARVWEASTGREVARMKHEERVTAVAFSSDGRWVASGGRWTARVWEASTGREVARIESGGDGMNVQDLAFSPDGQWVVSGGWDDMAQVWKTATGRKVACMEHEGWVNAVAFSPDGQWVATASGDGTARVWEASTGREVARMEHEGWVNAVAFSPDGQWVASASSDGTARVWALQPKNLIMQVCSHLPRNLTLEEWQQYIGDEPYRPTCPNLPVPEE